MPPFPRSHYVLEGEIATYHAWSRCVQRAFLCGVDPVTGENYDHRRDWIERLFEYQSAVFAVDLGNYNILSNHEHLLVRTRPDIVQTWSDEEVAWRWNIAWPHWNFDTQNWEACPTDESIRQLLADSERLSKVRKNLASLSWYMARVKEPIAKLANQEMQRTGHYYEQRYKCRRLEGAPAVLVGSVYMDLNQLAAGMAVLLDDSRCSAIPRRLDEYRREQAQLSLEEFHAQEGPDLKLELENVVQLLSCSFLAPISEQGPLLLAGDIICPPCTLHRQRALIPVATANQRPRMLRLMECLGHVVTGRGTSMKISQLAGYCVARAWLACSVVFIAAGAASACEPEQPAATDKQDTKQPPFQVRLLFVQRDWSAHEQIQREVRDALLQRDGEPPSGEPPSGEQPSGEQPSVEASESAGTTAEVFVPEAGHAAVFEPQQFANLTQWLRERKLLLNDQTINLEATRFGDRWTGSIQPSWEKSAPSDEVWHVEVKMFETEDPAMVARINVQRTHARQPSPTGPRLRGAAIDILEEVSFYLPKDRTVVMKWYAHPEDPRGEQQAVEPVLVFEASDFKKDRSASAQFHLPERILDLMLE